MDITYGEIHIVVRANEDDINKRESRHFGEYQMLVNDLEEWLNKRQPKLFKFIVNS